MRESPELRTMRTMAWERAKGELRSMAQTFWEDGEQFKRFKKELNDFIEIVEAKGLHE